MQSNREKLHFPNGNFLEAKLGNHPCFAKYLSSIAHCTKRVPLAGWEWPFTEYLRDKWLNQPFMFKLTSVPVSATFDVWVSLLIDPYTRAWKANMVTQLFSPSDASTILSISLSFRLSGDQMIWAYISKGDFTIRSAYNIAMDEVFNGNYGKYQTTKIIIYSRRHYEVLMFLKKSNHWDDKYVKISIQWRLTCVGRR